MTPAVTERTSSMTPLCLTTDLGTGERQTTPHSTSIRNTRRWSLGASPGVTHTASRGSTPQGRGQAESSLRFPPTLCPDKARGRRATRGHETGARPRPGPRGHRVMGTISRLAAGGGCPRCQEVTATSGSPRLTMTARRHLGRGETSGSGVTATPASWT